MVYTQLKNLRETCNLVRDKVDDLAVKLLREKNNLASVNESIGMIVLEATGTLVPVAGPLNDSRVIQALGSAYVNAVNQIGD